MDINVSSYGGRQKDKQGNHRLFAWCRLNIYKERFVLGPVNSSFCYRNRRWKADWYISPSFSLKASKGSTKRYKKSTNSVGTFQKRSKYHCSMCVLRSHTNRTSPKYMKSVTLRIKTSSKFHLIVSPWSCSYLYGKNLKFWTSYRKNKRF